MSNIDNANGLWPLALFVALLDWTYLSLQYLKGYHTPFQSKLKLRMASAKAPTGCQSDHMRYPWKLLATTFRPRLSS